MEEKITILNRRGKKLSAILHVPEEETNKIVIMIHSFKGDKDYQPIMGDCARRLCSEGYVVIRFDCYGSGESEGTFEEATITSEVEDLGDVIKFARDKGYTDIALIGLSLGTSIAILGHDEGIKALVLWSPPFTHKILYERYRKEMETKGFVISKRRLTGEEVKVGKKMWEEFGAIELDDKIKSIRCPTLVIWGTKDHLIKLETVRRYFEMLPCVKELYIIEGGDHDFLIKEAEEKAISKTLEWIKKYL